MSVGMSFRPAEPEVAIFHRRVHKWMRGIMRRSKLARKVASSQASYKLAGNEGGVCSHPSSLVSPTTEGSADLDRQFHYGGVSEGRKEVRDLRLFSVSPAAS